MYTSPSLPFASETNIDNASLTVSIWYFQLNIEYISGIVNNNVNILKYSALFHRDVRAHKCIWHQHKSGCTLGESLSYSTSGTRTDSLLNYRKPCQMLATPQWADGKRN